MYHRHSIYVFLVCIICVFVVYLYLLLRTEIKPINNPSASYLTVQENPEQPSSVFAEAEQAWILCPSSSNAWILSPAFLIRADLGASRLNTHLDNSLSAVSANSPLTPGKTHLISMSDSEEKTPKDKGVSQTAGDTGLKKDRTNAKREVTRQVNHIRELLAYDNLCDIKTELLC